MKLTIQVVNFRSRHYLEECLFSIYENLPAGLEAEIILINNETGSLDDISADLKDKAALHIVELNKNVGFGNAHNAGFRQSRGEYVLFLNPDTKLLAGSLTELLGAFGKDEKIGIVSPLLVDSSGRVQPDSFGQKRTPLSTIKGKLFTRKNQLNEGGEIFEADWVSGGAMMVRRDVFEKAGRFDGNFFMYFEDVDLCLRIKKMGYKIALNPAVKIFHESGRSFESPQEKKKYYYASQDYYLRKHYGPVWAATVKLLRFPYYIRNVWLNR